jgi:polyhydroxyalkanoate synthase
MELPSSPASSLSDLQATLFEEQRRFWRRMLNFPQVVNLACQTRVGASPSDLVFRRGTLQLLRYGRATPALHREPVLFIYALINRPYILDLQPDKSLVQRYLERGFEVYLLDWGVPSEADRGRSLEDHAQVLLGEVVDFICRQHGRDDLHLLGYCMGGTIAALFTALTPARVKTLTLLAAPIDFSGRESLLNLWTDRRHFDVDAFIDAHGNCPAWFLQWMFLQMKPIQNFLEKNLAFYEQLDDARAVANHFAMERWINDNVPVAGETFRQFVKKLYQNNELVRGQFALGQQRVDLGRIGCPLLLLTARNDHLVAPASTEGIRPHVRSAEIESMMIDAGHVGLVVGGKAHRTFWPAATRWLAERSTAVSQAQETGSRIGVNEP